MARVPMERTTFRTHALGLVGATNGSIDIVSPTPHAKRVVLYAELPAIGRIFVSSAVGELELPGAVTPGEAFGFVRRTPIVLALPSGQPLRAAATLPGASLSVSVSQAIPFARRPVKRIPTRSTFRTFNLPAGGAPAWIAQWSDVPQRVTVSGAGLAAVTLGHSANPLAEAFTLPGIGAGILFVFVKAPDQELYAASALGDTIAVAVSDISVDYPRGPTGIPGPAGQE